MANGLPELPVIEALPALRHALATGRAAVLAAPPGSGKTTLIPLALLDEGWLGCQRIVMLEPRRIAARAAAARMAQLRGEHVGQTVGYRIRFERKIGTATRIEVLTEGVLTRQLQQDPELPGVGLLIFDEFHERSLHADLGLALALDVCANLRPDLRLLVMSATLDTARVAALLGDAAVIESSGRSHPVDIRYRPIRADSHGHAVAGGVALALQETEGDVLAFLPGGHEIREAQRALEARGDGFRVLPLYGALSSAEQDAALQPGADGLRKVILATNIAQTSVTVEGVAAVVDGGQVRVARHDLGAGADVLVTCRVSRASADQRAGRAGRLGPGVAYRLWSREQHGQLDAHDTPEILAADLSRMVLELAAWGVDDPARIALLDAPRPSSWQAARDLLTGLGALDSMGRITAHGRALVRLPLQPRRGHMLLTAQKLGLAELAAWLAVTLDERTGESVDLGRRLVTTRAGRGDAASQRRAQDSVAQLLRIVGAHAHANRTRGVEANEVGRVLALAYPERIARRRGIARGVFLCADGGEARLASAEALAGQDWLAIGHWTPDARVAGARKIRLAAPLDESVLQTDHASAFEDSETVEWGDPSASVLAHRTRRFGRIPIIDKPWPDAPAEALRRAMLDGVRKLGIAALPWTDDARQWQARVASLRAWHPQAAWPELDDAHLAETLDDWLAPWLDGITRRDQLARLDLRQMLATLLDYDRQQRLARLAPTHLQVPSGSKLRLVYALDGAPPVLAVKLQELFGLARTPRIDDGGCPVLLQLLSPARRPIQVTQDLASFWANTYPDVKKELKGRYPKHPWPDDPMTAPPTARARRRVR